MNIQERPRSFNEFKNDLNNLESSLIFKITRERTGIQDVNVFDSINRNLGYFTIYTSCDPS